MKPTFTDVKKQDRTYFFADGTIQINGVTSINVSSSGTHRINTEGGEKWIVPPKWIAIKFTAEDWTF